MRSRAPLFAILLSLLGLAGLGAVAGALAQERQEQPVDGSSVPTSPSEPGGEALLRSLRPDLARGRIAHGVVRHRLFHFTFDDGPRPNTTPRLLELLDREGIRATFFIVARLLDARHHPVSTAIVQETARRGHTLGWHGFDHTAMGPMSAEEVRSQIERSERAFTRTIGARPWLFRPPFGSRSTTLYREAARAGYTPIFWSMVFHETEGRNAPVPQIVSEFSEGFAQRDRHPRGPGTIFVLHDPHPNTIEAFPLLVEVIRRRNCELLERPGEELWDIVPDLSLFVQPREGGRLVQFAQPITHPEEVIAARQVGVRREAEGWCAARSLGPFRRRSAEGLDHP